MAELTPVALAIKLLALPEGPTHKELQKQARVYLARLSRREYDRLKEEALERDRDTEDEAYHEKLQLFKRLQFTPTEAQAYAGMRIDSPGVRRVVARRALLVKLLKQPLPRGATFYEVAKMEDSFLKGLTDEQVLQQLGVRN